MVSLGDGGTVTAKLIDLGLAKAAIEPGSQTAISLPGGFAGTPEFASPEQFAGVGVDIRSDLSSLGVTLWQMLTGQVPFRGSPAEMMYQHLHAPLPLEELEDVPQPIVSLVESLLDKNPARRPQSPSELQTLLLEMRTVLDPNSHVESPNVIRGVAEHRRGERVFASHWRLSTESWNFSPFLIGKLKAFTGRRWLFEEIDEWRTKGSEPALLIIGEPGVGKSSIVATLVSKNPEGQVLAYHCCRADTPATLEPAGFVRSLVAMLSSQLDGYAAMLEEAVIVDALQFAETDPANAFESAILGPLHKLRQPERGRRYLLIDALDEALMRTQRPTIVDLLSTRLNLLPSWLRIVATTRNEPSVLSQLGSSRAHILSAQDPRNRDDVRNFIHYRLAEPALRDKAQAGAKTPMELASTLLRSSAGNFLFVTTALDEVESGQLGFDQIAKLPLGLSSLYELFFNRLFRDAGIDFACSRRVLETVAGAGEPLTRNDIAAVTGLDPEEQLPLILARLASFVPPCEGRYAFFHKSLFDWLTGWDLQHDQPIAGLYHVSLEKGRRRLADWCWTGYRRDSSNAPLYALRHLPRHLNQVGRTKEARAVLLDFEFIRAKLDVTDANALIADYEYLFDEADLQLVQSAIRLSAHVLALDRRELTGQLTGRLLGSAQASIQAMLQRAAEKNTGVWLRPLTPSLTQPGGRLIRTLQGHTRTVGAVVVMPDSRRAVSASQDNTLRLWDLESGQVLRALEGHTDGVTAVAVTPDGCRAISGSADHTLRVWELKSGQTLHKLEGHTDLVTAVAMTPDGRRAVSGSCDRTLRLWDLESSQTISTLKGHTNSVRAVAVTPDGFRAISGSDDRALRLWDLGTGQAIRTLEGHTGTVWAVAVTLDGHCAVSGSDDQTLRLWDLESGQALRALQGHTSAISAVALTPDGRRAVSVSWDNTLRVWDLESGQTLRTLQGHKESIQAVAVTLDGRRALSGSGDGILRLWDLETDQTLHLPDANTDGVTALVLLPDGRGALLTSDYHTLRVRDLESGQPLRTFPGHTDWITAVAATPDGRRAVSASADGMLRAWNLQSGKSLCTLQGHTDAVTAVAITPDGRHAISASADRTLRAWDLESGQSLRMFQGQMDLISAVATTPDGLCAVWGSDIGALRAWDLESGETVKILVGHTHWVTAVAVTPDRQQAVSASADGTLRVWNLQSGEYSAGFTAEGPISRFAIAPDGRTIIGNEISGRAHFLRLEGVA
jgi:WD40 repeat protein